MALSIGSIYEVRTGGSDSNGGGFDPTVASPGTDYSQQNSAQVAYTDLVIGATTTNLTSVGTPFTSAHVGNFIQINSGSGFTTGIYCINSVATGIATMDRSVGSAASTVGHGNLGGAFQTPGKLFGLFTISNEGILKQKAYFQAGTFTLTSAITISATAMPECIGYTTSRGDGGQATITTATNSTPLFTFTGAVAYGGFVNFIFSNTAGTPAPCFNWGGNVTVTRLIFSNCVFNGFTYAIQMDSNISFFTTLTQCFMFNCIIENCTQDGILWAQSANNTQLTLVGCYIKSCSGNGINISNNSTNHVINVFSTVIYNCTLCGIRSNQDVNPGAVDQAILNLRNSCFVANGDSGVEIRQGSGNGTTQIFMAYNCIFTQNTSYGIFIAQSSSLNGSIGVMQISQSNAFYGNGTANVSGYTLGAGDITLTGDPFTSKSTGDFTLNSGAGAPCKAAGFESSVI